MSLRTLLPIGRAFGGPDRPGRYRPAEAGQVPDFSDVTQRRPAGAERGREEWSAAPPSPGVTTGSPSVTASPGSSTTAPSTNVLTTAAATPRLPESARSPFQVPQESVPGVPTAPLRRTTGGRAGQGSRRTLPVWIEEMLLTLFGPGNRRRSTRVVQTEMNFERVSVARNDLQTSDVEVVVVPTRGKTVPLSPGCRGRIMRLWWTQGASRIRRWGASLF